MTAHSDISQVSLSSIERRKLRSLEAIADAGKQQVASGETLSAHGWLILAGALAAIREQRLYRDWGNWSTYVEERHGFTMRRANHLVTAYMHAQAIAAKPTEYEPDCERVLRAIPAEATTRQVQTIWRQASDETRRNGHERVTSTAVERAVERVSMADAGKLADKVRREYLDDQERKAKDAMKELACDTERLKRVVRYGRKILGEI